MSTLGREDLEQLNAVGISEAEAKHQLALLRGGARPVELERPCRLEDGIQALSAPGQEQARWCFSNAAEQGRTLFFVPASGAATRMFAGLRRANEVSEEAAGAFFSDLHRFPFYSELAAVLEAAGVDLEQPGKDAVGEEIVSHLLGSSGLGYDGMPKALIPFHLYPEGERTPLEDHLVEGASLLDGAREPCRAHFTVAPDRLQQFRGFLDQTLPRLESKLGRRLEVGLSCQSPSTDTLAVDGEGEPFRLQDGRLLLRPGGHGALLRNLQDLQADIVLIRNIDNIQHQPAWEVRRWMQILGGEAVRLHALAFEHEVRLDAVSPPLQHIREAACFLRETLGASVAEGLEELGTSAAAELLALLRRPLRVCGVVPNQGHAGGGPFWVRDHRGRISKQIVEGSQVDGRDSAQSALLHGSTHFNPVALACALRDRRGRSYQLAEFVDRETVFVAEKSHDGRPLRALEHPGLWNGAMAFWNTVFVEMPLSTFAPVKSVLDLLAPAHQPRLSGLL